MLLPSFEIMLAEEVVPSHFVKRKGNTWTDARYYIDIKVNDQRLSVVLRDSSAMCGANNTRSDWIWSHSEDLSDPKSIGAMHDWVADLIAKQDYA